MNPAKVVRYWDSYPGKSILSSINRSVEIPPNLGAGRLAHLLKDFCVVADRLLAEAIDFFV